MKSTADRCKRPLERAGVGRQNMGLRHVRTVQYEVPAASWPWEGGTWVE